MGVTGATTTLRQDLAQLDALASQPDGEETDERVLTLVGQVAARPGGLAELVARYATAPNALLPRAVSFALAQRASTPSPQTWALTREFAGLAWSSDDPSTLINVLTAVQRHLGFDLATGSRPPEPALAEFVLHCLEQAPLVRAQAIALLVGMAADGTLQRLGTRSWTTRLRRIVRRLGQEGTIDERDERELLAALGGDR